MSTGVEACFLMNWLILSFSSVKLVVMNFCAQLLRMLIIWQSMIS
ncbi:MAG: hypothetical protein JWM56_1150 [Candidatus Peribacteria bacterium]|nr:hypothetical protein [Candidatus Peribacteria bacterium]